MFRFQKVIESTSGKPDNQHEKRYHQNSPDWWRILFSE
jgi:hypothetical protein